MNKQTMKRPLPLIFLSTWILSYMGCISSPSPRSTEETLIVLEQRLLDGVAIGARDLWKRHMADSCMVTIEDGTRLTGEQFLDKLHPLPQGYNGKIKVIEPRFRLLDRENVVISYIADEYLELYGQLIHTQYAVTNTWMYKNGWKLSAMQTFEIPKNPLPIELPMDIGKLLGTYTLSHGVRYTVTVENHKLYGQRNDRPKMELLRETGNVYFTENDARVRWIFVGEQGKITKLLYRRSGNDLVWQREAF